MDKLSVELFGAKFINPKQHMLGFGNSPVINCGKGFGLLIFTEKKKNVYLHSWVSQRLTGNTFSNPGKYANVPNSSHHCQL